MKITIINGPNLNLLGSRETNIYGSQNFESYLESLRASFPKITIEYFQSNIEGEIINKIHESKEFDGIILNAAAYTHTSIAIHDAFKSFSGFKVELHISNPHLRESFRHVTYVAPAADAVVAGLGADGYSHVIDLLSDLPIKVN